jgi:hypothetical protein
MCVYGHPTDSIFQPPTLTFLIGNYSTLIFASDLSIFTQNSDNHFCLISSNVLFIQTASFLSKLRAKKLEKLRNSS